MLTSKELQEQVAEQRRLLQSVASVGEELLGQQTTPNGDRYIFFWHLLYYSFHITYDYSNSIMNVLCLFKEAWNHVSKYYSLITIHLSPSHSEVCIPGGVLLESETLSPLDQLRQRWENLNKDQSTKLQLSLNSLEQDQLSPVQMQYIKF